jgi:CRISPR-associated protein Cas2
MFVVITYDVSTVDRDGRRRLRQVARACEDWGQRVQNSVFECLLDPAQYADLRKSLIEIIDPKADSLRFYHLGSNWRRRVEHVGAKPTDDLDGPLLA